MPKELWKLSATEVVSGLRAGYYRPSQLVEQAIARIEEVDKDINALPIRCFDRAYEQAKCIEKRGIEGDEFALAGLPFAVKDYNDIGGVRTTYGSPIYANYVPSSSDATVARLEGHGGIPLAKSNVPEWAGGHTDNTVNGVTRNPWNTSCSAGGSSGGSAAALASGQIWLATGNDFGGSLRTPAGFNGVVGLRPGPGLIPRGQRLQPFDTLWVEGPMARNIQDIALMLDAGAGHAAADPLSFDTCDSFVDAVLASAPPTRVAFSSDLDLVPVSREITRITGAAVQKLESADIDITEDIPDFGGVLDAFQTLRAFLLGTMMGELLQTRRAEINEDIAANIERGFSVTAEQLFEAERIRWKLYHRMAAFFKTHDLLICPSSSIPAFPIEQSNIKEIDGQKCETYIDWFAITFALTMTSCPVVSIPCGFTSGGLPVGLQLVGRPRGEAALLAAAKWIEDLFGIATSLPINPKAPIE